MVLFAAIRFIGLCVWIVTCSAAWSKLRVSPTTR
jgi:hypothetical protein